MLKQLAGSSCFRCYTGSVYGDVGEGLVMSPNAGHCGIKCFTEQAVGETLWLIDPVPSLAWLGSEMRTLCFSVCECGTIRSHDQYPDRPTETNKRHNNKQTLFYIIFNRKTCASCQCYKRELQSQTTTAATSTAFGTGFNYAVSRCEVVFVCVALLSM